MTLRKHIVILVVFFLLTAISMSGCLLLADNALDKLPFAGMANFNAVGDNEPIRVSYFDKISKRVRTKHYSFTSETEPTVIKGYEVIPTYTTCDYFTILNEPLDGTSFSEGDQQNLKKKAVISDTLALKLYFNTDVAGETLELNGEEYIISGVFKDSKNLLIQIDGNITQKYNEYCCEIVNNGLNMYR